MYVVDTNAIIYSIKQKVNLEKFLLEEIVVPSSVVEELENLSKKDNNAKLALMSLKKYRIVETSKKGDDGVIDVALRNNGKVVTNDAELIGRLKELGISTVSISLGMVRP